MRRQSQHVKAGLVCLWRLVRSCSLVSLLFRGLGKAWGFYAQEIDECHGSSLPWLVAESCRVCCKSPMSIKESTTPLKPSSNVHTAFRLETQRLTAAASRQRQTLRLSCQARRSQSREKTAVALRVHAAASVAPLVADGVFRRVSLKWNSGA